MTVLVLAPHADDEVLGMGGTIARLCDEGRDVVVAVLTGHGAQPHPIWEKKYWDVVRKECYAAASMLGVRSVIFEDLPAACLDHVPAWTTNSVVASVISRVNPDELYVPFAFDLHKDHTAIAYAASVAARPYTQIGRNIKRVLAYETLSETHLTPPYQSPGFQPNVFFSIEKTMDKKILAMQEYKSQLQDDTFPRSINAIRALATLRGTSMGVGFAEAFVLLGEYGR